MELYIIRHAQSTNNALADLQDRVDDPPLTDTGQRQAEILARHLATETQLEPAPRGEDEEDRRDYHVTRLFCSPMWRALQTAYPVGQALGLSPEVWVEIHEKGGVFLEHEDGPMGYPGGTRQEISQSFPGYILSEGITEQGWWHGTLEEWPACHGRAIQVAQMLREWADTDERIAIISHGGFLDALLKALFNQLPGRQMFYFHHNTAISRIDFYSDGRLGVRYLNRTGHLPLELVT